MIPFRDDVPSRTYPVVTVGLILLNSAAFVYQFLLPDRELQGVIYEFGLVPADATALFTSLSEPRSAFPASLVTSMFLHGGLFHLFGNMWYLWIFGDNVEDRMGHLRFLLFYLLAGVAAGFAHMLFNPTSAIPSIGASGAVAGVLGAYLISYPFARVLTIVPLLFVWPIIPLPAILVLGSWFAIQLLSGTVSIAESSQTLGGVAWWAHVGGFLTGLLLVGHFAGRAPRRRTRRDSD